ncbi:hypothetical protein DMENIID0001_015000 [Sergentomyia squamirostris]
MDLKLNEYCLLKIFSHLELRDLVKLELVCQTFRRVVQKIYPTFTKLDTLEDGCNSTSITKGICVKIGRFVKTLRVIENSYQQKDRKILAIIFRNCPNIQNFDFMDMTNIASNVLLSDLSEYVRTRHSNPNLIKRITLIACNISDMSDQVLRSLEWIKSATGLEVVSFSMNSEVTGKCLKYFKNLKEIDLHWCKSLQNNYFMNFCKSNQTLIKLNIKECFRIRCPLPNQECINSIAENLQNLEVLALHCSYISNATKLSALADLPKLKTLNLEYCNLLAVPLLNRLAKHDHLKVLEWSLHEEEKNSARLFLATIKIQGLKEYIFMDNSKRATITDELVQQAMMNNLEKLKILWSNVTDEGIYQFILKNPSLKIVDLTECNNITDEFAKKIIPHLQADFKSLRIVASHTKMTKKYKNILARI